MGIPTCLVCKTPWGHTLDCELVNMWRTRMRDLEAAIFQLYVVLPEHQDLIAKTVSDCDTRRATTSVPPVKP